MTEDGIQKLYYSISEVSQALGIDQHVLRFWETEFKELAPRKNKAGNRLYKESDLQLLKRIKQLLYEEVSDAVADSLSEGDFVFFNTGNRGLHL